MYEEKKREPVKMQKEHSSKPLSSDDDHRLTIPIISTWWYLDHMDKATLLKLVNSETSIIICYELDTRCIFYDLR